MKHLLCCLLLALLACARHDSATGPSKSGAVAVRARPLVAQLAKTALTTFDSLIVAVYAADLKDTVFARTKVSSSQYIVTDTVKQVPAGSNRYMRARTVDTQGRIVNQSHEVRIGTVEADALVQIDLILDAVRGSLAFQFLVPTNITSILACFTVPAEEPFCAQGTVSSNKVSVILDYIPAGTEGIVDVQALDAAGEVKYFASYSYVAQLQGNSTVRPLFTDGTGSVEAVFTIEPSPVALALGEVGSGQVLAAEIGPLVISEIMYNAHDSEYVEIHNPTNADAAFDTLLLQIDNKEMRMVCNVEVVAGGYAVIACRALPWADYAMESSSHLDLNSSGGNWIRLWRKDLKLMDLVALPPRTNTLGWPNPGTAKTAIVCTAVPLTPDANNYGTNWRMATSLIDPALSAQKGSPGKGGL